MKKAGALIDPIVKQLGLEPAVRLSRLRTSWHGIFSEPLISHTWPASLSEGELVINVDHPAYLQQFVFLQREVLAKLGPLGITGVRFRIGKVAKRPGGPGAKSAAPLLGPSDRQFVASLAKDINDADLKEAVERAAAKSLAAALKKKKAGR